MNKKHFVIITLMLVLCNVVRPYYISEEALLFDIARVQDYNMKTELNINGSVWHVVWQKLDSDWYYARFSANTAEHHLNNYKQI